MATITLTQDNLETVIEGHPIVVIDFWASWCGPCRTFAPVFEAASEQHADVAFGKVDVDDQQGLAAAFQVQSIPNLVVFKEQVGVFQQAGALSQSALDLLIEKVRELDMVEVRKRLATVVDDEE